MAPIIRIARCRCAAIRRFTKHDQHLQLLIAITIVTHYGGRNRTAAQGRARQKIFAQRLGWWARRGLLRSTL